MYGLTVSFLKSDIYVLTRIWDAYFGMICHVFSHMFSPKHVQRPIFSSEVLRSNLWDPDLSRSQVVMSTDHKSTALLHRAVALLLFEHLLTPYLVARPIFKDGNIASKIMQV